MATPSLINLPPPSASTVGTNADASSAPSTIESIASSRTTSLTSITSSDFAPTTTSTIPSSESLTLSSLSSISSNSPTPTPSHSSGLTKGQIAAIVGASIAGTIGLLFFSFVISVLLRRRKRTRINTFRPTSVAQFIEQGDSIMGSSHFDRASGMAPLLGGSRPSTRYSDFGQDVGAGSYQPVTSRSSMEPPHYPYGNTPNTLISSSETIRGLNAPPMTTELNSRTAGPVVAAVAASALATPPPLAPQQQTQIPPAQHRQDQRSFGRHNTTDTVASKYSQASESAPGGAPPANLTQHMSWPSAPEPSRDNSLFLGQSAPLEGTASLGGGQGRSFGPRASGVLGPSTGGNIGEHGEYVRGQGRTSPQSQGPRGPN